MAGPERPPREGRVSRIVIGQLLHRTVSPVLEPEAAPAAESGHGTPDTEQRREAGGHCQSDNYEQDYFEHANHCVYSPGRPVLCARAASLALVR